MIEVAAGFRCSAILNALGPARLITGVMLAERIAAVAPNMPPDVRRWFLEQDYARPSTEHQDWDLVLADRQYVPLLVEYALDRVNLLEKRFEALSALMVSQEEVDANTSESGQRTLKEQVQQIVRSDREFARSFSEWVGAIPSLVVRKVLGEELPRDLPQWMYDEIQRRA